MRRELNALDPSELARLATNKEAAAKHIETPAERSARIAAEYDAAIKRKREEAERTATEARRNTPEYEKTRRRAAERRKERRAAELAARPANWKPRKGGKSPAVPDEELSPSELEKRIKQRERYREYHRARRERARMEIERIKRNMHKAADSPQEASQSHADNSAI